MWSLADDVEHVLAHRDVKDWYVFEAASWTLAEQRMPAERRRELWLEPLPAAELAGRLRRLPLFASVTVDELFRMASASRQVRHETGSVLAQEGSVPSSIHILLDGRVTAGGSEARDSSTIDAPAALAFFRGHGRSGDARDHQNDRVGRHARADRRRATDAARRQHRSRQRSVCDAGRAVGRTRHASSTRPRPRASSRSWQHGGLTAIDRVFALQYVPLFRRVSADEMQQLATVAAPVKMTAGSVLFPESAPPALWLLLTGEVMLESSTGKPAVTARGGDTIGSPTRWPGRSLGRAAKVVKDGVALKIDREDLFDVLGERPDLLRQMFAGMFKRERPADRHAPARGDA